MNPSKTHPRGNLFPAILLAFGAALLPLSAQTDATYQYFRFTPTKLINGATTGLCQLSEFGFVDDGFFIDQTGLVATNPGGMSPAAEGPEFVVDGSTATKWLGGFNGAPIGSLVFTFPEPVTIDAYTFATANDALDARTPVSWIFEGSSDGVTWICLDVQYDFAVPAIAFDYIFPDILLPDEVPPAIRSFTKNLTIVANGDPVELGWETACADTTTIDPAPGAVGDTGTTAVTPPSDADTEYTLTASNTIDTVEASLVTRAVEQTDRTFRYYRFGKLKLRDEVAANSIQLSEFRFFDDGTELDLTALGVIASDNGNNPANELPAMLIDGDTGTKWLNFDKAPITFDFGVPITIDAYSFTTANDGQARDPVAWYMEASDDNATWTILEQVSAFDFPTPLDRFTEVQSAPIPLPAVVGPVITQFVGDAPRHVAGEPVLLTWQTVGATSVSIDNGVGPQDLNGSVADIPAGTTTYVLTATGPSGAMISAEFTTTAVSPLVTEPIYADFNSAGEELVLLGSAAIVNDFFFIPEPGDVDRLRLTPEEGNMSGTAWFAKRVDTTTGFDMTAGLHFVSVTGNTGADGMSFMLQNSLLGNNAAPTAMHENGLAADSLNIKIDSYLNADQGETSAAALQVRDGTTVLVEVDLTAIAGITLAGTDPLDLTDDIGDSSPYQIRVAYTAGAPGTLDVFFKGVRVINSLSVDLEAMGAVDGSGTGYIGWSARTGGAFESHDITSWHFTEGPPVLPAQVLRITAVSRDAGGNVTINFVGAPETAHTVLKSPNLEGPFVALDAPLDGTTNTAGIGSVTVPASEFAANPAEYYLRLEE